MILKPLFRSTVSSCSLKTTPRVKGVTVLRIENITFPLTLTVSLTPHHLGGCPSVVTGEPGSAYSEEKTLDICYILEPLLGHRHTVRVPSWRVDSARSDSVVPTVWRRSYHLTQPSPLTWYHHVVPSLVSVGVIAVGGSHLTEVLGLITTEE